MDHASAATDQPAAKRSLTPHKASTSSQLSPRGEKPATAVMYEPLARHRRSRPLPEDVAAREAAGLTTLDNRRATDSRGRERLPCRSQQRRITSDVLMPPKAKLFETAISTLSSSPAPIR